LNAQERKALKRALLSKENWKAKARKRQKLLRIQQLKIKDLEQSRAHWKEKLLKNPDKIGHDIRVKKEPVLKDQSVVIVKKK
jgi:hypothetical protein